jgi:hypothetical protein
MKKIILLLIGAFLFPLSLSVSPGDAWECEDESVPFTYKPSDYYGSGEYFALCPEITVQIRCYRYHRHWVCQKGTTYYWDRNLESAARTACNCHLPEGVIPASPAISKEPETRFLGTPAQ